MENYFYVHCIWHDIILCIQDGLKVVNDSIVKLKQSISFIKYSSPRKQTFKAHCFGIKLKSGL